MKEKVILIILGIILLWMIGRSSLQFVFWNYPRHCVFNSDAPPGCSQEIRKKTKDNNKNLLMGQGKQVFQKVVDYRAEKLKKRLERMKSSLESMVNAVNSTGSK